MTEPTDSTQHSRHSRVIIDLDAIRHNYRALQQTAPDSKIIAVIKADAYGHGAIEVARALPNADAFAVATSEEAIQLRKVGIEQRIIVLGGPIDAAEMLDCFAYQLDPVCHQFRQIDWLEQADPSMQIDVWLKLNSGMGRLGFGTEDFIHALELVEQMDVVNRLRLMTHLANADDTTDAKSMQQIEVVEALGLERYEWGIANSAGILGWPGSHRSWVRAGIALYGADPSLDQGYADRLRPAMTFTSQVLAINHRKAGEAIGYGGRYICSEDQTIAVVAAGYADGYPRHLECGYALLRGQRADVVGRVSMDMITLNVTDIPVEIGDEVVLWGANPLATDIASRSETIAYELFCHAGCHGRREYLNKS